MVWRVKMMTQFWIYLLSSPVISVILAILFKFYKHHQDKNQKGIDAALSALSNDEKCKLLRDYWSFKLLYRKDLSKEELGLFREEDYDPYLIENYIKFHWFLTVNQNNQISFKNAYTSSAKLLKELFVTPALITIVLIAASLFNTWILYKTEQYAISQIIDLILLTYLLGTWFFMGWGIFLLLEMTRGCCQKYSKAVKYYRELPARLKQTDCKEPISSILKAAFNVLIKAPLNKIKQAFYKLYR